MKPLLKAVCGVVPFLFLCLAATADTVTFFDDTVTSGIILRTNATELLILSDYGTVNWPRATVRTIVVKRNSLASLGESPRLADFKQTLLSLNNQAWATDLKQIPAIVINEGIMRRVPYLSFRCGEDYEVNVYGDLSHPAAVEAGVYRKLSDKESARSNCIAFIKGLLSQPMDKESISKLGFQQGLATRDGMTFEVTAPTAVDAYDAWWISVYSPVELDKVRATDAELAEITTTRSAADNGSWTAPELELARSERPKIITVTTSSGYLITNAEVVSVNEGVSLIWRRDGAAGLTKLADLSPELRAAFGYDAEKSAAAERTENERRKRDWEQELAQVRQAQAAAQARGSAIPTLQPYRSSSFYTSGGYSGGYSTTRSSGGSVFVRGYTRSNGTFVPSHTRSSPRGRR